MLMKFYESPGNIALLSSCRCLGWKPYLVYLDLRKSKKQSLVVWTFLSLLAIL